MSRHNVFEHPSDAVLNVAAYIFKRLRKLGPVEAMKLQKLLYYCNAWSLADRDIPMFNDEIQAWKHGPVVASIYPLHRGRIDLDSWPHGKASALTPDDARFVDEIVDDYGGLSGWRLRNRTHREAPWIEAWGRAGHGARLRVPISTGAMITYYRGLRSGR